ncbi:hypothetical protein DCE94_09145 [Agromyces badenianii]|nr:hypothetical protein DCE94_09145 [Agromyces badenianii]
MTASAARRPASRWVVFTATVNRSTGRRDNGRRTTVRRRDGREDDHFRTVSRRGKDCLGRNKWGDTRCRSSACGGRLRHYTRRLMSEQGDRSDGELLLRASRNDDRAFAVFYHRHAERVFAAALDELADHDEAQQITQQVFATAWDKAARVRLVAGSAEAWLSVTCRNLVANRRRALGRRLVAESLDEHGASILETRMLQRAADRELLVQVEDEIAEMPFLDQQVYRGLIVEGRSYDEVSAQLELSVASVGKRLNRVRKRLRVRFGGTR